jgi:hypothetical protein
MAVPLDAGHVAEAMDVAAGTAVVVRRRHLHDRATGRLEEMVLHLIHTVTAADGAVLEVSESVWADRVTFIDEYDIPAEAGTPVARSDI